MPRRLWTLAAHPLYLVTHPTSDNTHCQHTNSPAYVSPMTPDKPTNITLPTAENLHILLLHDPRNAYRLRFLSPLCSDFMTAAFWRFLFFTFAAV